MLEFQNGKIELYGGFGIRQLKIVFENFSDDFSAFLHEVFLFLFGTDYADFAELAFFVVVAGNQAPDFLLRTILRTGTPALADQIGSSNLVPKENLISEGSFIEEMPNLPLAAH